MGLAPYCKPKYYKEVLNIFRKFQTVRGLNFVDVNKPKDLYFTIKELIENKRFDAIAGGLQAYTEELIVKWISNCVKFTGLKNVCLAGGVGLNVKANYLISKLPIVKNLYVPPSPDDSSQGMGACYASYVNSINGKKKFKHFPKPLKSAYLGFDINKQNIKEALKKYNLSNKYFIKTKKINQIAAKMISSGKIIGRAIEKAEFGARALGNRSILADPSKSEIKKTINEKVKNRDFWMPFAASVLAKYAKNYFVVNNDLESYAYMTNCLETTKSGRSKLIAALHPYDLTCRPHILKKNINLDYENLINCFDKLTGIYGLLNTSFNIHGQPIVNTIDDSIKVFLDTDLDGLLVPGHLIIKNV